MQRWMCTGADVQMCRCVEAQLLCRCADVQMCKHAEVQTCSLQNWNPDSAKMNFLSAVAQRLFLKKFDINKKYQIVQKTMN
jgi:hypothetical protein